MSSRDAALEFAARVRRGEFCLDATVRAEPGEVLALLGPNGAGKSTLVHATAGLAPIDEGRIQLGTATVDDPDNGVFVSAQQRRVGVVFQDHRLFPHLRVRDNVAFGLRTRGMSRHEARSAAHRWLDRLDIAELALRRPRELSGGQVQRVALARALASEPRALLLDEPLAALDVQTRAVVQGELRDHLSAFDGPAVIVTHDPVEALLLATRIVVLESGRIVQDGTPAQVTTRPATPYVARLVGVNLYRGLATNGTIALDGGWVVAAPDAPDGRVLVAIRPSTMTVHTAQPSSSSARNVWRARIESLAPLGDRIRLAARGTHAVLVDVTAAAVAELDLRPGGEVWLSTKATDLITYPEPSTTMAG